MDSLQLSHLLHIQEASKQGRLVVFVGAGVSNNSEVPTWRTLIDDMKNDCDAKEETDDLKIAQLYKDARGEKEFMDKVKEVLLYNKVFPNPIHGKILELSPCHIITTNYDDLLEQQIENDHKQFAIIKEDKDMPNMSYPNSLIKMHGDFDSNNIVLTESDYYNYQRNFPLIRSFVLSLFASKLVVFVGFSFADLNLKMILNDLHNVLKDSMQRAYLISDVNPSQTITQYYSNKGINVVYVDEEGFKEWASNVAVSSELTNPKGIYLYKVLSCIGQVKKDKSYDLVDSLYSQLLSIKDEMSVVGNGLKYFIPKEEQLMFNPHSDGLQLFSPYFKALHQQLKTFAGRKKFILDHSNIDWKELKQLAYNNYLYEIDDVKIVDPKKQYELNIALGDFAASWYFYNFDMDNLSQRLLYLSARDLSGDSKDLEYPFILYKLGRYYEAYKVYNQILPLAWKKKRFIIYFICLYNLHSLRYGVSFNLMSQNKKMSDEILEKLSNIDLDNILSRLPISDGIRKTFQDLLSFRELGASAIDTENKREQIFHQRKSGEKGGVSLNSNIDSLLSKFDREFQFCNNNYIVCDNNSFFKAICYNTVCGILNSYATPDAVFEGINLHTTKIDKLFPFCIFTMVFCMETQKLKEIFRRYEIKSIELADDGVDKINEYWKNLDSAQNIPSMDFSLLGEYIDNLIYVTSKVNNDGIDSNHIYSTILKFWDTITSSKVDGNSLALILSRVKPNKDDLSLLLNKLLENLETRENFANCYEWLAYYMDKDGLTYNLNMSVLKEGKYAREVFHLYKILSPEIKQSFSEYCQNNLNDVRLYLEFIVTNELSVRSTETLEQKIGTIDNNPQYYINDCCYLLAKMSGQDKYSNVHSMIDSYSSKNECMKFHLSPSEYEPKENVDVQWILRYGGEGVPELAKIPEYKQKLKQYLVEKPFIDVSLRNAIINVL
jgi:hypothetical protein